MFLETICIDNNKVLNIDAHIKRMNDTAKHFGFNAPRLPSLIELLPQGLANKKVRCSITYNSSIVDIKFVDYMPRKINSLKLVQADIDYDFKFADRNQLNSLLESREDCDEILIVKSKCITDTTFSNVVFESTQGLFTPDTYLLNGTKRQALLKSGTIAEKRITIDDLYQYSNAYLINAMLDVGDIKIERLI